MTEMRGETLRLSVLPPFFPAAAVAIAWVLDWLVPLGFLGEPSLIGWQGWLGIVVALAGVSFALWAVSTFGEAGTDVETYKPTTALVTNGPYEYSRNPIYVGFLLIHLGISVGFTLEWGLFLLPLLWLALDRLIVVKEEALLSRVFGDEYRDFCNRTRRWI